MSRSPKATFAPAWARAIEMARPNPRAAPVTRATEPVRSKFGRSVIIVCHSNVCGKADAVLLAQKDRFLWSRLAKAASTAPLRFANFGRGSQRASLGRLLVNC